MMRRRSLLVNGNQAEIFYNEGTFTGNDSSTMSLNIGFAPDVVVISSDVDYSVAGWAGAGHMHIIKDVSTGLYRHNNTSATSVTQSINFIYDENSDYGDTPVTAQYCVAGTYSNGVMTITNQVNVTGTQFKSDRTYHWYAYGKN